MITVFDVFDALMNPLAAEKNAYLKTFGTTSYVRSSYSRKEVKDDVLELSIDLPDEEALLRRRDHPCSDAEGDHDGQQADEQSGSQRHGGVTRRAGSSRRLGWCG